VSAGHCHIPSRATAEQIGSQLAANRLSLRQCAARAAAKRHSPVGCHDNAAQPKYICPGSVGADRRRAAGFKPAEQSAFCRRRGPADRVVDAGEQRNEVFPPRTALNRERSLAGGWQHLIGLENLRYRVELANPG
jgi:hypothetical protein